MLKSASQFRNPHLLSQVIFLTFHSRTCRANLPHYILNGPYIQCYVGLYSEKPGPHKPGNEKKERTLLIHDGYPSTERKSFSNLENRKPDLGGSGLSAVNGDVVPPIIAYPAKKASSFLLYTLIYAWVRSLKLVVEYSSEYLAKTNRYPSTERISSPNLKNKKPDLGGSGFRAVVRVLGNSIIAHPEIKASSFLLCTETSMGFEKGYIRIPRSLLEDPKFKGAPPAFRIVLIEIINHAAIAAHDFNDHSKIVRVEVGEICFSLEIIRDLCGSGVSKKQVERSITYFKRVKFLGQRPGHRRSILKITHPDTYDLISKQTGTRVGTRPGQDRDISREGIERKEEKKRESARSSTSFGKFVKLETAEYEALSAKFGKPELDAMIEKINDHCESTGRTYVGFAATIRAWFRRERPAQTAPLKAESALAFLQEKLGMDRVQEKFGILEVTSAQGYVIQQFEKKDLEAARKWFAERHGKVINGTT